MRSKSNVVDCCAWSATTASKIHAIRTPEKRRLKLEVIEESLKNRQMLIVIIGIGKEGDDDGLVAFKCQDVGTLNHNGNTFEKNPATRITHEYVRHCSCFTLVREHVGFATRERVEFSQYLRTIQDQVVEQVTGCGVGRHRNDVDLNRCLVSGL